MTSRLYLWAVGALCCTLGAVILAPPPAAGPERDAKTTAPPSRPADESRMAWFRAAKFGMFIHWGIYAVPAGEWDGKTNYAEWIMLQANIPTAEYEKLAGRFDPEKFDAREWVRVAKEAGMKYIVITAKHHDGFCMYDTKLMDYNIVKATPFKRDPMKELAAACHEAGLVLCFYYSIPDWHHPDFPAKYSQHGFHGDPNPNADLDKYVAYLKGQVRELLTNYGPIGIIWFDGGGSFKGVGHRAELIHAREIIDMIHQIQPNCLVNNRLGTPADYGTPEQKIPGERGAQPFEVCMTLNRHWGYNAHDHDWKSPKQVAFNLADIVSKGGNYLLNVGPTAGGVLPKEAVSTLREVGQWLKVNGDAIYDAGPTPFGEELGHYSDTEKDKNGKPLFIAGTDWRCTTKPGRLYVHINQWPSGPLTLLSIKNRVTRAYLLADAGRKPLAVKQADSGVTITLPEKAPDSLLPVVCLEVEGPVAHR